MSEQPPITHPAFPPADVPVVPHRAAPVGPLRHLLSTVVALLAVPLAYVALDYALSRHLADGPDPGRAGLAPIAALGPFTVALLLLFIGAATGRISGLGPLLAGVVWGVLPGALALAAPLTLARVPRHLPQAYDSIGLAITSRGIEVFPLVAVLLLGAAVSGRWR